MNGAPSTGFRYHVAGTWDGTTLRVFFNGVERDSKTPGGSLGAFSDGNISDADPTEAIDGIIDEVRISNIARSPDWIAAQHLSMTDAFITYNAEEMSTASCP